MPILPELQQTNPYLAEVEGFRTMARLHGIPTGAPECIASLPLRLAQDWRLRGNFVELLRELQRKDPDFALPDALAVLLLAIGGPNASPNRHRTLDESVNLTAGFLASLGGWPGTQDDPITDLDHPSDQDPRLDPRYAADAQETQESQEPQQPTEPEHADAAKPEATSGEDAEPAKPDTPAGISLAEITQALARLERGSVDLRLHLDSIDQRLSRMEPLLESEAPAHAAAAPRSPDTAPPLRPAEVIIAQPEPAQPPPAPSPEPLAAATHPQAPAPSPKRNLERDPQSDPDHTLVHRSDPPPAISPTPLPSSHLPEDTSGTFKAFLDTQPRPLTPRRDRFAAAMELTGARSTLDFPTRDQQQPDLPPFHVATDHEPTTPRAATETPRLPEIDTPEAPAVPPTAHAAVSPLENGQTAPEIPSANASATSAPEPASSVVPEPSEPPVSSAPELTSPTPEAPVPASAAPATPQHPQTPVPPDILSALFALQTDASDIPPPRPAPAFTFAGAAPADQPSTPSKTTDEETSERVSHGPLVVGIVAALLITIAAILLLRGKPIPFLTNQPRPTASEATPQPPSAQPSSTGPATPARNTSQPTSHPVPTPNRAPTASAARSTDPATRATPAQATSDRALPARQTSQPAASEHILETPTFVPEAAMKSRVLSAPAPLYPKLANAVGLEGGVIFEAIIAKDGTVDGLTVLGGQRLLRDAATNAVRQWRYQPFLLHGEPVEVRSIIHVNVTPPAQGEAGNTQ